jgi:G:T-mismatch repair DNA endonuclease (very short patch repair protein)
MKEIKKCIVCKTILSKNNTNGTHCNKHRDRTGKNNPFFGKTHNQKTIEKIKEKTTLSSKTLWKNEEYRKKVISGATGKHRSDAFKEKQRQNALKQYVDPYQHKLRSDVLKQTWKDKKIVPNMNSSNESKIEKEFYREVDKICPYNIEKKTIHVCGRSFMPDVLVRNNIIFEFYGDFWHGNPRKFKPNDILYHGIRAEKIWQRDQKRVVFLEKNGYDVYVVWEWDFKNRKQEVLKEIDQMFNWDENFLV